MDFQEISKKAIAVREKYQQFELKEVGHEWSNQEIMEGFVGDVGDLMKLVMAKGGSRKIDKVDSKLSHELCDCLWCILVLAKKFHLDLEKEFLEKMDELNQRIEKELQS